MTPEQKRRNDLASALFTGLSGPSKSVKTKPKSSGRGEVGRRSDVAHSPQIDQQYGKRGGGGGETDLLLDLQVLWSAVTWFLYNYICPDT